MDQDGTWTSELMGGFQSGVHHAVHHHDIRGEALRLGEDVVAGAGPAQRGQEPCFHGVLEGQPRRPGWH